MGDNEGMLSVLSPAKSLDFDSPVTVTGHTEPRLIDETEGLIEIMRTKSPGDIAKLMRISEDLAHLNATRYREFTTPHTPDDSRPAVLAFNGDVYQGLRARDFDARDLTEAQKSLRILSGLYGTAASPRPDPAAPAVEMGTRWPQTAAATSATGGAGASPTCCARTWPPPRVRRCWSTWRRRSTRRRRRRPPRCADHHTSFRGPGPERHRPRGQFPRQTRPRHHGRLAGPQPGPLRGKTPRLRRERLRLRRTALDARCPRLRPLTGSRSQRRCLTSRSVTDADSFTSTPTSTPPRPSTSRSISCSPRCVRNPSPAGCCCRSAGRNQQGRRHRQVSVLPTPFGLSRAMAGSSDSSSSSSLSITLSGYFIAPMRQIRR